MRKIVMVLMVLFTIGLAGGLYNTLDHLNTIGEKTADLSDATQLTCEVPDIVLSPATIPMY